MALTQISTAGVKDDAVTSGKIPANAVGSSELADNAVDTAAIADQAVDLTKLPHGTSSNDGKFLRANNGADPSFETITGTTINNNADNRVITGSGTANTLNGESGLTFNGTKLGINETSPLGLVHIDSDDTTAPLYIDCATNNKALTVRNPNGGDGSLTIHGASNECDWAFNTFNTSNALHIKNDGKVGIRKTPSSTLDIETASNANGFNLNCIGTPANYFFNVRDDNVSKFYIKGSDGNVGIGTDSPTARLHIDTSHYVVTSSGKSTTGIHLDGTHGNSGEYGGGISFACGGAGSAAIAARQASASQHRVGLSFFTHDSTTSGDNAVEKVRLHDSGEVSFNNGICLGNSLTLAAANTMDDYEEGTWTPKIKRYDSGNWVDATMTNNGSVSSAIYRKIGAVVHFFLYWNGWQQSNSNYAVLGGLPYAATGGGFAGVSYSDAFSSHPDQAGLISNNGSQIEFYVSGNQWNTFTTSASRTIYVAGTYMTA